MLLKNLQLLASGTTILALLAAPPALAQSRSDWNSLLERDELTPQYDTGNECDWPLNVIPSDHRKGWKYADGGFGAYHAGSNRSFFFFGDTGFQPDKTAVPVWESNTMLVAKKGASVHLPPSETNWGDAHDLEFWARKNTSTFWGEQQSCGTDASLVSRPWMTTGYNNLWLWPNGQLVPAAEATATEKNKLYGFWSVMRCQNLQPYTECERSPENWPMVGRAATYPTRLVVFADVSGPAGAWVEPTAPDYYEIKRAASSYSTIVDGIEWGAAIFQEPTGASYFIFGVTLNRGGDGLGEYTDWDAQPDDIVLAKATPSTIASYDSWLFWKNSGSGGAYLAGAPLTRDDLRPVGDAAAFGFTVSKASIGGTTRNVLVQDYVDPSTGDPNSTHVAVRVSGANTKIFPNMPASPASSGTTWVAPIGEPDYFSMDPPCDPDEELPMTAYQARAHWPISNQAANKMMISYYCARVDYTKEASPNGDVSPRQCDVNVVDTFVRDGLDYGGRIRFYDVDLAKLKPWCTAAPPACFN